MANPVIETPLKGAGFSVDGFAVEELGFINKVNLRGDFESSSHNNALLELTGISGELDANRFSGSGSSTLFWLGPNERLLYTDADPNRIAEQWRSHAGTAAVDVSDYLTVLRLSGEKTRDVIASGAPFDVHPEVFAVGQCAQTRYGNASILLANQAESPEFHVQVRWSFADYVFEYMKRVAHYV